MMRKRFIAGEPTISMASTALAVTREAFGSIVTHETSPTRGITGLMTDHGFTFPIPKGALFVTPLAIRVKTVPRHTSNSCSKFNEPDGSAGGDGDLYQYESV
jgi:hypothetical protein